VVNPSAEADGIQSIIGGEDLSRINMSAEAGVTFNDNCLDDRKARGM